VNNWYDNTTFVDCSPDIAIKDGTCIISIDEMLSTSKEVFEETNCNDETYYDDPKCCSDT